MNKKLTALACAAAMALPFAGCNNAATTYTNYVRSVLDCTYYNEQTEYMELTDSTAEEAQAVYDDEVEYMNHIIMYRYSVVEEELNGGIITAYSDLSRQILKKAKYTVEPAVRSGTTYHVTVTVEPMDYLDLGYDEIEEKYENDFDARFQEAESDTAITALENEWAEYVLETMKSHLDDITYKEAVSTIVEITTDDDGNFGISDKDWLDIDDLILDLDSNT